MDLSIEKKNQRKLAEKKRLIIHQSFNNRLIDFNKLLKIILWTLLEQSISKIFV